MEVAGVVLAVIPLLISALEHYDNILQIVDKYQKFSSKVRVQHDDLSAESTIFRAECVLLLAGSITRIQAEQMLQDIEHPLWHDDSLIKTINRSFGSLGQTLETVMKAIKTCLAQTALKLRKIYDLSDAAAGSASSVGQNWRSSIKKRLKFALASHNSIQEDVDQIAKLNKRFVLLCSQIRQLEVAWNPSPRPTANSELDQRRFDQCTVVREIFVDLYDIFLQGCPSDHQHILRLRLDADCNTQGVKPLIVLDLRYGTMELYGRRTHAAPATKRSSVYSLEFQLNIASKVLQPRTGSGPTLSPFSIVARHDNSTTAGHSTVVSDRHQTSMPLSKLDTNLCAQMGQFELTHVQPRLTNSILLRGRSDFEHSMNVRGSCTESYATTSLAELFSQMKTRDRYHEIPLHQRLGIAKCLGLRLLELYETPWWAAQLSSANLYFLGELEDLSEITQFGYTILDPNSLYIDVELTKHEEPTYTITTASRLGVPQGYVSRFGLAAAPENIWLYNFGVLLLELAYQTSFSELKKEVEDEFAMLGWPLAANPQTADYQIACQLAEHVGRTFGASYARIVRQCLRCSFDVPSSSLLDKQLRWAVYRDVVCQLRRLRGET